MAAIIEMPKLSDTMEEGAIAAWIKKEGDFIEEGETLLEVETDKATMEYASPEEGVILKILVKEGESCALNAPIAVVGEKGEKFDPSMIADSSSSADKSAAKSESKEAKENKQSHAAPEKTAASSNSQTHAPQQQSAAHSSHGMVPGRGNQSSRVFSSPYARRLAEDKGINLQDISGTGPNGRIVAKDIENFSGAAQARSGSYQATRTSPGRQVEDRQVKLSMMRKTIAKRLTSAKNDAPHFYLTISLAVDKAMHWRQEINQSQAVKNGDRPKISFNDIVTLAVSRALARHPEINASWAEDSIIERGNIDIGLAVALEGGLITPVVRHADQLGLWDIAAQSRDLILAAKDGKLGPEQYANASFTISNLGMFGIEEFTAIINPPGAAILAVGAAKKQVVVDDNDEFKVSYQLKVTMSCDHRVIDGAAGANFLATFKQMLEDPQNMLL